MNKKIVIPTLLCFFVVGLSFKESKQKTVFATLPEICKITEIAAGNNHNLAIDEFGNLWAWGNNSDGQLGDGTKTSSNTPKQIMKGHKFKKISAGYNCSAAIDTDGKLYGWGYKTNPTNSNKTVPTLVSETDRYREVLCGYSVSVSALTTSTDPDFYYGYGYSSYYMEPNFGTRYLSSTNYPAVSFNKYSVSTAESSSRNYTQYSEKIICGDGIFYYAYFTASTSLPYRGAYYRYMFLISESGALITSYQASNRSPTRDDSKPRVYFENLDLGLLNQFQLTDVAVRKNDKDPCDSMSSTAYFVTSVGDVYSVGKNGSLSLIGNNDTSTDSFRTPQKINGLTNIVKVSAGESHILALDSNGRLFSWGDNSYGQLGLEDNTNRTTPTGLMYFENMKHFSLVAFAEEINNYDLSQGGATAYQIKENPSKGSLTISNDGQCSYAPSNNVSGDDYCVITIQFGSTSLDYELFFHIDRKPVFTSGTPSLALECGQTINGSAAAFDADGDDLTFLILQDPSKGSVTFTDNHGSFAYTARSDVAGGDNFVIGVSDGYCTIQYPVSVHVNSLITFDDDTNIVIDTNQSNVHSSNVNATDIDGDTLVYSVLTGASKGTVTIDENGNYLYTANGLSYGNDSFVLRVDDGYKPLDIEYNVHIYAINDGGTVLAHKVPTGENVNGEIVTTAFGIEPTYSIKTQALKGLASIDEATGEYLYVPDEGSVGDDSFVVKVDYGYGNYCLEIHIYQNTIPNDANVNVSLTTHENASYFGSAACIDIDNDILTYTVKNQGSKGSVTISETTGEYSYTPYENVVGNDTFDIEVSDDTESIVISFNIHIESEISLIDSLSHKVSQNTSVNGNVNAIDRDGDTLIYSIQSSALNGVSSIDSLTGDYVYIPFTNFFGDDSFAVKVDDGVLAKVCMIYVTVNRSPMAESYTINMTAKGVTVSGSTHCSDPDGDALTYSIVEEPTKGSAIIDSYSGAFAYTPELNAAGNDVFKVNATDGVDNIVVTVNIHNETDVYMDEQATRLVVNQGKSTTGQIYAVDLDGDALTYSLVTEPTQGSVNINSSTGAWTYYSSSEANGVDSFTVKVTDGQSEAYLEYDLVINTPASFDSDSYSINTNMNNNYNGQVIAVDADGDSLAYSIVRQAQKGLVTIDSNTGNYLYIPASEEAGNDSFIIGVSDGNFVTETVVNVHIESPVTVEKSVINHTIEKYGMASGNINAFDKDGDALSYSIYQQGQKGTASVMGDGGYSYLSTQGAGEDAVVIAVTDNIHVVYVTIYIHVSSNPYFEESSISIFVPQGGNTSGQVYGFDEDGDQLNYSIYTQPVNGTVNLNSVNGKYTYIAFSNSTASSDSFVVAVTDGSSTSYATINVVINNAPKANNKNISCKQGGNVTDQIFATDPENDLLTFKLNEKAEHGNVTINSETGVFEYITQQNSFFGNDNFSVAITDGYSTIIVMVNITVVQNLKPTLNSDSDSWITVSSGSMTRGRLNIQDPENDRLTYRISMQGEKGEAYIDEDDGYFSYRAYENTRGYDCFIITVSDGINETSFLVQVKINYVDSNNSWAIPTSIALGVATAVSFGMLLFVLLKFGKKLFAK